MWALPVSMLPHSRGAALSGPHRFLVIDGSGSQEPGARTTQYRVHLCMDLVPLSLTCIALTDQRTGECLKHFALEPGEVAVADRGSCQPETMVQTVPRGADVRRHLTPDNMSLSQYDGTPLGLVAAMRPQAPATICTLHVRVGQASQPDGTDFITALSASYSAGISRILSSRGATSLVTSSTQISFTSLFRKDLASTSSDRLLRIAPFASSLDGSGDRGRIR
jgi:hypothetical protein